MTAVVRWCLWWAAHDGEQACWAGADRHLKHSRKYIVYSISSNGLARPDHLPGTMESATIHDVTQLDKKWWKSRYNILPLLIRVISYCSSVRYYYCPPPQCTCLSCLLTQYQTDFQPFLMPIWTSFHVASCHNPRLFADHHHCPSCWHYLPVRRIRMEKWWYTYCWMGSESCQIKLYYHPMLEWFGGGILTSLPVK